MAKSNKFDFLNNKLIDDGERQVIDLEMGGGVFISPFCLDHNLVITKEAADFLESGLKYKHYKRHLHLNISDNNLQNGDMTVYEQAVRNYYLRKYAELYRCMKRKLFFSLIMLILGLFTLGLMAFANILNWGFIISNFIDIIAWVFLWEAADVFFFQRFELRRELNLCAALYRAKITVSANKSANLT